MTDEMLKEVSAACGRPVWKLVAVRDPADGTARVTTPEGHELRVPFCYADDEGDVIPAGMPWRVDNAVRPTPEVVRKVVARIVACADPGQGVYVLLHATDPEAFNVFAYGPGCTVATPAGGGPGRA